MWEKRHINTRQSGYPSKNLWVDFQHKKVATETKAHIPLNTSSNITNPMRIQLARKTTHPDWMKAFEAGINTNWYHLQQYYLPVHGHSKYSTSIKN